MAIIAKKTPTKAKRKEAEEETPASPSPSSPDALAELLLADPLANANCLPKLLALEAAPRDEVRGGRFRNGKEEIAVDVDVDAKTSKMPLLVLLACRRCSFFSRSLSIDAMRC